MPQDIFPWSNQIIRAPSATIGNPSGGNLGTGSLNAQALYQNGVLVSSGADVISRFSHAVTADGGALSQTETTALTTFVQSAMQKGYWGRLIEVMPMMGGFGGCFTKLKWRGYPQAQNNGFVAADYSTTLGLNNTTTKYVDTLTNYNDYAYNGNQCGLAVFVTGGNPTSGSAQNIVGSQDGADPQVFIRAFATATNIDGQIGGLSAASIQSSALTYMPSGLFHFERQNASLLVAWAGGCPFGYQTGAMGSSTPANGTNVCLFATSGNALNFIGSIGFFAITDGTFTDELALAFAADVNVLLQSIGRTPATSTRQARYLPTIGQSLATGTRGTPITQVTNTYNNLMPAGGVYAAGNVSNIRPTVWNAGSGNKPVGIFSPLLAINDTAGTGTGNTVAETFAQTVSIFARAAGKGDTWDTVHSNFGVGATRYTGLARGTQPYNNSLAAARYIKAGMQAYTPGAFDVPAVLCVHGESDEGFGQSAYQTDIRTWQANYQADFAPALTSGRTIIPMLHSQPSNQAATTGNMDTALAILAESIANPTLTICVCPKYFFTYSASDSPEVHLSPGSQYALLGDYYAKAFWQQVVLGNIWKPLQMGTPTRNGVTITIPLIGCVGVPVIDTTLVASVANSGFSVISGSSISSVAVSGSGASAAITVTLSSASTTQLAYAYGNGTTGLAGPTSGCRGNIRDSDTTQGSQATNLYNWLCHQELVAV